MEALTRWSWVHEHHGEAVCLPQTGCAAVCHQLRWNKLQDACNKSD